MSVGAGEQRPVVKNGQLAVARDVNRLGASQTSSGSAFLQRGDFVRTSDSKIQRLEFFTGKSATQTQNIDSCTIKADIQAIGSTRSQAALEQSFVGTAAHITLGGNGSQFLDVGEGQRISGALVQQSGDASRVNQIYGGTASAQCLNSHVFNGSQVRGDRSSARALGRDLQGIGTSTAIDHVSGTKGGCTTGGANATEDGVITGRANDVIHTGSEHNSALKISPQRINDLRAF